MNFKFVRHKLLISSMLGVLCFTGQDIVSEAAEIDAVPDYTEVDESLELEEDEVYGEFSFGDMEGYAYIYSEASSENGWIGKLYDDNRVTILSIEDTWAEIESGNVHGYVKLEYLLSEDEAIIRDQEIAVTFAIVDTAWLNVRTGPSTDYEIVDTVASGTELLVVGEEEDGWEVIQLGEEICYVSGDYTIEEVQYSYAESKEEEAERLEEYENALLGLETTEISVTTISTSVALSGDGQSVVDYAMQFLGNPYVWGGTDLVNGADCSGFVQSVYADFGISLPRTSSQQRSVGVEVSYSEIQVGDIICYEGHVGIYIGDDQIINAIGSAYGIGISSATYADIITIRRVI